MGPESKTDKSLEHGQSLPQTSILSSREDCSSWDLKQRRQLFRTGAKLLEDDPDALQGLCDNVENLRVERKLTPDG